MEAFKLRSGLKYTKEALRRGKLVVGYLGGSITDGRSGDRWSDYFSNWIAAKYSDKRIIIENAAMGSTGSDFAVLRVEKQIIERKCDLVFLEYAVNDREMESGYRYEIREGLLRKLLKYGKCDIVLVYTHQRTMIEDILQGKVPESIREFEELAEYYGIPSVWPGLKAFEGWQKGLYQYYEWLPDGLHPQSFGSNIYAYYVEEFFGKALVEKKERRADLPEPIYKNNWEDVYLLGEADLKVQGCGYFYRPYHTIPVDLAFQSKALGTKLTFDFYGTGCVVVQMQGKSSYGLAYRVDDGEVIEKQGAKADWMGNLGHFAPHVVARNLERKQHHVEIEPKLSDSPEGMGNMLEITFVGIIP